MRLPEQYFLTRSLMTRPQSGFLIFLKSIFAETRVRRSLLKARANIEQSRAINVSIKRKSEFQTNEKDFFRLKFAKLQNRLKAMLIDFFEDFWNHQKGTNVSTMRSLKSNEYKSERESQKSSGVKEIFKLEGISESVGLQLKSKFTWK